ncbi:hypothetical protein NP493_1141g00043 [Ridgeia piscesae]|uniref:SEC14-like protein 2 n=1 Tax=Ridgeia piscesae TaxID=27915 RepID=A0AAD9NKS9_RIDPI|nr:hypothetical protein NP493_1141g00043 [Ridgeia piscesae]
MLRNHLEWRKSFGTDTLLDWDVPEVMRKYWPGGVCGHDKEGHPILYQLCKDFDTKGMLKSVKKSDIVKLYVYRMEQVMKACEEESKKRGKIIDQAVDISDLDGFHLGMVFAPGITDAMKQVFAIYEANYPENLHASYVINAPSVFAIMFTILRPFLSEETKRKVHILGRNWKEVLLRAVDKDQLPAYWGGDAVDPEGDAHCRSQIAQGGKIPSSYYLKEQVSLDRDKMEKVTLQKGTKFDLKFHAKEPEVIIRWLFETEDCDIGFGVLYRAEDGPDNGSWEEVVPVNRVNSYLVPEDGSIVCGKAGIYMLRFDNSYSWVHGKTLYYEAELMEPSRDVAFERETVGDQAAASETTRL